MRTAFINELILQARRRPEIFLIVGDLGFSVVEPFANEFPDRFLNIGVAEQNMIGVAAGLAVEGYHVFAYSIANFPTLRCAEQIRNDVAYHGLNVTIVTVGGGLSYGNLGYSHHAVQDYALLRSFPGMLIAAPCDPAETRGCVKYLAANPQPSYLRLGKAGEPSVHLEEPTIKPGHPIPVKLRFNGTESINSDNLANPPLSILTTGATAQLATEVAMHPHLRHTWHVHSLPLWRDVHWEAICDFTRRFDLIVTLEDHLRSGGFGSFIRECLEADASLNARVRCIALDTSVCGRVASQKRLNELGGLERELIVETIRNLNRRGSSC